MSRIKEIWCMPHSHLDIGYTHPQPMLLELQWDYLQQALQLCRDTMDRPEGERFCWTVEANYVLKRWLKTASQEDIALLKDLIRRGQVCVTAMPFHTTPCADANEMVRMMEELDQLRQLLETDIRVAINHDINGQPWTLGQILMDSGVDFYMTGINIHFGGVPFIRPASFLWEMADGRKLQTYLGEHYSLFSQYLFTEEHNTARMHEGALAYAKWLEELGYQKDYVFLTATNPPLYDNNCPDAELADLIQKYNAEGHEFRLRLVTAEDLRRRVMADAAEGMPTHRGDWTDYWNFGCASTAREGRVSRLGKQTLEKAEVVDCFRLERDAHRQSVMDACYESTLVFEEHTWGASQSVTQPDCPETYSQLIHKKKLAYEAADMGAYLLGSSMEKLSGNPHQSNSLGGVTVVNTSGYPQTVELEVPRYYMMDARQLAALRIKGYATYMDQQEEMADLGLVTLPPFTAKTVSFADCREQAYCPETAQYTIDGGLLTTPYHCVTFDPETGAIRQIVDKTCGKVLDESRGYSLFEPIREIIDESQNPASRKSIFPRDVDLGNHSITQWNHDWKNLRITGQRLGQAQIIRQANRVTIVSHIDLPGTKGLEQRITFYTYQPKIHMTVTFLKEAVYEPEAIYFALPLQMQEGWKCTYDTAGQLALLDEEQIGNVCRDWITVDTAVSVYGDRGCVTLACPDAPMVQVGDFGFGKESRRIPRNENPLLLAWPMNNYWDTNFCADQSGTMTFSYDLLLRETFCPIQAMADGIAAKNPCVFGASVEGKPSQRTLLDCQGNSVVLHLYPEADQKAIRLLLVNPTAQPDDFSLSFPDKTVTDAAVISPTGKVLQQLQMEDGCIRTQIAGNQFRLIRVALH